MAELNLMEKYPRVKRNLKKRGAEKTGADRRIARRFGKEFFDGDRAHGYGGFTYHPRFWTGVVADMVFHYGLSRKSSVLDIGCAKGFMLHDFRKAVPGMRICGIDISRYAIEHALPSVSPFVSVGDAKNLSAFGNKSFDLVVSINTVHNLPLVQCKTAIREIERVGKHAFIVVDAWRNAAEKERLLAWNLTARTMMSVADWKKLFAEVGYTGDYWWFWP